MSKKTLIILIICLTIINAICINCIESYASVSDDLGDLDQYRGGAVDNSNRLVDIAGVILGVLQAIGAIVSVVALMLIGIKYMLGSAEQKANYKQIFLPYIVGAIIVFTTTALPNMIYQALNYKNPPSSAHPEAGIDDRVEDR